MDSTTKSQLRRSLQKARLALAPEDRAGKSTAIASKLFQAVDWSASPQVHCFEPITRLGEVDLTDFVSNLETAVYTSRKFGSEWRIISVNTDKPAVAPKFDVIIVPMLGFDGSLHRVGYGGGYYDRFLAEQPQARKIGVCFEVGKVDKLPVEPHDVALDMIITEKSVYGA